MALKLLQGPIQMFPDPTDENIVGLSAGLSGESFYLDEVGLVGEPYQAFQQGNNWVCVNLDGMMSSRSRRASLNQDWNNINYDYTTNKLVGTRDFSGDLHLVEPINGTSIGIVGGNITDSHSGLRLPDRIIKRESQQSLMSAPISTGVFASEYTFPSPTIPYGGTAGNIMPGPGNTLFWYIGDNDGTMIHYDWKNRKEVEPQRRVNFGWGPEYVYYSLKYDFFIAVGVNGVDTNTTEIYIYANEVVPSLLTNPVALTPITQGRISTLQVRLEGAEGAPIGDRLVDWTITAGNGTLASSQSKTDELGVAEIDYIAPLSGGLDPTVEAQVTY